MISLDGVSWHPRCAPEFDIPKLDRVSTHVEKNSNYQTNSGTNLHFFQRINFCLLGQKNGEEVVR